MAGSKNNKKRNLSKQSPDPESNATGGPPDKYSALELSPPWFTTPLPVQTILDPVSNSPYWTPHTPVLVLLFEEWLVEKNNFKGES